MRPRVFPAEDAIPCGLLIPAPVSFNEAAGIPRGRRRNDEGRGARHGAASMRPRVFPAEDVKDTALNQTRSQSLQ